MYNFLVMLEQSGSQAKNAPLPQDYKEEVNSLKAHYEHKIAEIKSQCESTINSYKTEIKALNKRCEILTEKNKQLDSSNSASSKSSIPQNPYSRRNSENSRIVVKRANISNGRRDKSANDHSNSKNMQLEDENLKLKKQLEELNGKFERSQKKWEIQMQEQKKSVSELTSQLTDAKLHLEDDKK